MGKKAKVIVSSVLLLGLAGGVTAGVLNNNAQIEAKYATAHTLLSKAKDELASDDLAGAAGSLQQAKILVPESHAAQVLTKRLSLLRDSKVSFDRGQSQLADKNLSGALDSFRSVASFDLARHSEALNALGKIELTIQEQTSTKVKAAAAKRAYQSEIDAIDHFYSLFPGSNTFDSLRLEATTALAAEKAAARKAAIAAMRVQHDKFQGEDWYTDRTSPYYRNANGFYLYFGASGGSADTLRLVMQYYASDWLFINSASVLVDGDVYDVGPSDYFSWKRDNDTMIWEWSDEVASDSDLEAIRAIIHSKSAIIRYEGDQYHDDRTITATEKAALARVLTAYEAMGGY